MVCFWENLIKLNTKTSQRWSLLRGVCSRQVVFDARSTLLQTIKPNIIVDDKIHRLTGYRCSKIMFGHFGIRSLMYNSYLAFSIHVYITVFSLFIFIFILCRLCVHRG